MKTRIPDNQLSLFEATPFHTPSSLRIDDSFRSLSWFLALLPDSYTGQRIAELGSTVLRGHNLRGKLRPVQNLHLSLHSLNRLANVEQTVRPVCEAVAAATRPFEIKLDRIMSFRSGSYGKRPLVLVGDDQENGDVKRLHRSLRAQFATHGPTTGLTSRLNPHVTLLYEQLELPLEPVEPIFWTAREIVLIGSDVGNTKYHFLERWPLRG